MDRSDSFLPPYTPLRPLSLWLSILLLTTAAASALAAGFEITEIRLLAGILGDGEITSLERYAHSLTRGFLVALRLALLIATVVLFVTWLFVARVNARSFGCRRFSYSRRWAVLAFAVPGINLIRPLQILGEVWQASDPRGTEHPLAWKSLPLPDFLSRWWWMLWISGALTLVALAVTTSSGVTIERLLVARAIALIANLTAAATAVLGYLVVSSIDDAQDAKWSILSGWAPPQPLPERARGEVGPTSEIAEGLA